MQLSQRVELCAHLVELEAFGNVAVVGATAAGTKILENRRTAANERCSRRLQNIERYKTTLLHNILCVLLHEQITMSEDRLVSSVSSAKYVDGHV